MAGIVKGSINLSMIPKDKIIQGKKGKYLPVSITVNDEEFLVPIAINYLIIIW